MGTKTKCMYGWNWNENSVIFVVIETFFWCIYFFLYIHYIYSIQTFIIILMIWWKVHNVRVFPEFSGKRKSFLIFSVFKMFIPRNVDFLRTSNFAIYLFSNSSFVYIYKFQGKKVFSFKFCCEYTKWYRLALMV